MACPNRPRRLTSSVGSTPWSKWDWPVGMADAVVGEAWGQGGGGFRGWAPCGDLDGFPPSSVSDLEADPMQTNSAKTDPVSSVSSRSFGDDSLGR